MAGSEQHYIMPRAEFDRPVKLLIVVSPYYKDIADNMVAGAVAEIEACGGSYELVEVPGALEIPTAISMAGRMSVIKPARSSPEQMSPLTVIRCSMRSKCGEVYRPVR